MSVIKNKPPERHEAGFTLLEVVLALSIFALIGMILYGAFSLSHNAVSKAQVSFEKNQKLRSAGELLGSYIRSSYPYRASPQDQAVFFDGEEQSVTFVSSFSLALGGRGMARIHIFSDGGANRPGRLRLEEEVPVRLDEDNEGGVRNGVVIEDQVADFRLAYLDPQNQDDNWEQTWNGDERHMLPRAVRLSYRALDGKQTSWVVPIMMNVLAQ